MADIIEAILSEEEVIDMPSECLQAFVGVFNVQMKKVLLDYMMNPESNKEVVEKLDESVGADVKKSTFHMLVKDKRVGALLRDGSITRLAQMAYNNEINLQELIDQLEWLEKNNDKLQMTVQARTKDAYALATKEIAKFMQNPNARHTHKLDKLLLIYKDSLFCPKFEKATATGMRGLILNKDTRTLQKKYAEYLQLCIVNNISQSISKELTGNA